MFISYCTTHGKVTAEFTDSILIPLSNFCPIIKLILYQLSTVTVGCFEFYNLSYLKCQPHLCPPVSHPIFFHHLELLSERILSAVFVKKLVVCIWKQWRVVVKLSNSCAYTIIMQHVIFVSRIGSTFLYLRSHIHTECSNDHITR